MEDAANPLAEAVSVVAEPVQEEAVPAPEPNDPVTAPPEDEIEDEYEGRKYRIPKAWRDERLMHADYTRKTMALAEEKRAVTAWKEQQEQVLGKHREAAAIEHEIAQYKDADWTGALMRAQDDATRNQIRDLWMSVQSKSDRLKALNAEIEASRQNEASQQKHLLDHWTSVGAQVLRQKIKDWGPGKQSLVVRTMQEYGVGSTDPRLDQAAWQIAQFHPAIIAMAHDAALYRQSLKKATETPAQDATQPVPAQRIGGSAVQAKNPDKMTDAEWAEWRNAQLRKKRA